jgi:hypothetical protein
MALLRHPAAMPIKANNATTPRYLWLPDGGDSRLRPRWKC